MFVTLMARTPCWLCGYFYRVLRMTGVRVNRRSLRERGVALVAVGEHRCPECGHQNVGDLVPVSAYRLHPEDEIKVEEYRARKWPAKAAAA